MAFSMQCSNAKVQSDLHAAILLYGNQENLTFASIHGVDTKKGQPRIKAGNPVTKDAIRKLMESLNPLLVMPRILFQQNVLAAGPDYMAWYMEPSRRTLWFSCNELEGVEKGEVPLPGLVFIVLKHGGWYVYAYKGKGRPDNDAVLFNSPFLNVWERGVICEGNAGRPENFGIEHIGEWEERFFTSRFTHTNTSSANITRYKPGAYQFWRDLLSGKWKQFPQTMLVSTNQTLQSIFDKIVVKGGAV